MQQTSLQAFEDIKDTLGRRQLQVYRTIIVLGSATDYKIANWLHWPINWVTGRRNELEKNGYIYCIGTAKNPMTNKQNRLYAIKL